MRTQHRLVAVLFCLCALALSHANDCEAVCKLPCSPSNAGAAFRQVQLLSPTSGTGHVLNAGHPGWPLSLDDAALVRAIGGGDSVLIASSRLHGVSINLDGSVTYTLPPDTRANRIAAIVTANDGTDPLDYNFPLLFVSATFSDGRHWGVATFDGGEIFATKDLAFGHDVRNWSNQVAPSIPLFVAPPPAPSTFQLYAGPSISGPDSVFYDLQVVDIPDTLRNTALSTLTFSSVSVFTSATGAINGLAVWPSLEIRNRQSGALGLQQQYTGGWEGRAYGGYVLRDTLFGAFKKIQAKGCILSCMAMVTSYFGDSVRVDQMNEYLVRHHGYGRDPVVRIASLTGQEPGATLTYTEIGDTAKLALHPRTAVNDTLLFEDETARAWRAPVVTAVVGPTHGQATIRLRHQNGVLSVGSHGYAYVGLITSVVTDSLAQGHWTLADLGRNPTSTPRSTEQALTWSAP